MRRIFYPSIHFAVGAIMSMIIVALISENLHMKIKKPYEEGYESGLKQGRKECVELIKATKP